MATYLPDGKYTFPTEIKFRDKAYARSVADRFLDILLASGTTTAQVFTTTFPQSVDAFFEACSERNICLIAGLTGIDRPGLAPPEYQDTADSAALRYIDCRLFLARRLAAIRRSSGPRRAVS